MKKIEIAQLDETDMEFADIFVKNGFSWKTAKTIVAIKELGEASTKEIMQYTNLAQPEVSLATRDLITKGYVKIELVKREGKGRPHKVYTFSKDISNIISDIEKNALKNIEDINKSIERLKELS